MNIETQTSTTTPDLEAVKSRQRDTWAAGDYAAVGTTLQIVGEQLCEQIDLAPGSRVLDVAAGNGNATLAAARRFCAVTSTDYVDALLDRGRARAVAEGLNVDFQGADAEALPFADAHFDVVLSTFGVMFTPNQTRAAAELLRVCRPGGVIGLSNWTPEGFIGRVFGVIGRHLPPPAGLSPPSRWGTREAIENWFGTHASEINLVPKHFVFRYASADHFLDYFRNYYGPMHKAFAALAERGAALEADLRALLAEFDEGRGAFLRVPSAYVDVVIRRR